MRLVKFRGKAVISVDELNELGIDHNNGWIIGNLIQNGNKPWIVGDLIDVGDEYIAHEFWVKVIPETVGQYTGLKDKGGKEIYEGDIGWDDYYECYGVVKFDEGKFSYIWENISDDLFEVCDEIEIVGHIYEDSKLLGTIKITCVGDEK